MQPAVRWWARLGTTSLTEWQAGRREKRARSQMGENTYQDDVAQMCLLQGRLLLAHKKMLEVLPSEPDERLHRCCLRRRCAQLRGQVLHMEGVTVGSRSLHVTHQQCMQGLYGFA